MRKDSYYTLEEKKERELFNKTVKVVTDYLEDGRLPVIQFGNGNLLPFFTQDESGYAMTIFRVDVKRPFEVATPEEQDILLAEGTPLVIFDFPKTPAGLNGISVLMEWITDLKEETD